MQELRPRDQALLHYHVDEEELSPFEFDDRPITRDELRRLLAEQVVIDNPSLREEVDRLHPGLLPRRARQVVSISQEANLQEKKPNGQ